MPVVAQWGIGGCVIALSMQGGNALGETQVAQLPANQIDISRQNCHW